MCGRLCCEVEKDKLICILVHTWTNRCDEDRDPLYYPFDLLTGLNISTATCTRYETRLDDIIFPELKQQINQESLSTFAAIARRCLNRDHKERPNMVEVVKELEVALHHQQNPIQHEARVIKTPTSYGLVDEYDHLKVRLEEIKLATNNFSPDKVIGRGGFGQVYKGELSLPGGKRMVCFKRLDRRLGRGKAEFLREILLLSEYKHENLVSLLNICDEGNEMILVYNYAYRGSLDRYLSEPGLTWTQRLKICVGVAHAMSYLHDPPGKYRRVLHRDVKSSNILLDEVWTAKVFDFGMSKFGDRAKQSHTYLFTNESGTPGYCDPLYQETGILTKESDVYSFGVVLFEVMCGRLCTEYRNGKLTMFLHNWLRCYDEKRLEEIIFSELKEQMDSSSLNTFSSIAYRCLKSDHKECPTMAEVANELELALEQQKRVKHEVLLQEDIEEKLNVENLVISPMSNKSQNQNIMQFPKGVLVGDGNTWLSELKNGKVCEVIFATKCISAHSVVHDDRQNSRFSNVIKGGMYNGFKVKVTTQFLSPNVIYTVSLVFKHNGTDHGTHIPFKFKLDEARPYSNTCMTHVRDGGWLMIELYQFTSYKREHSLGIHFLPLFNLASTGVEYFIEGVEFRPIQYVAAEETEKKSGKSFLKRFGMPSWLSVKKNLS